MHLISKENVVIRLRCIAKVDEYRRFKTNQTLTFRVYSLVNCLVHPSSRQERRFRRFRPATAPESVCELSRSQGELCVVSPASSDVVKSLSEEGEVSIAGDGRLKRSSELVGVNDCE